MQATGDWWVTAALYGPSLLFALLFVVSTWREPRRFRNAIWLALFILFFSSALLLRFGSEKALVPLALVLVVTPLVVFAFLVGNAVIVWRKEGLSGTTVLPFLLACLLAAAVLAYPLAMQFQAPFWVRDVTILFTVESLWFFFTFAALLLYSWVYRLMPRRRHYDYIIIHGAGLEGTRPTPLLRGRIEKAYDLWNRQGRTALFVVSGGQGADEEISEAEAMRRYLEHDLSVNPNCVIMEDRSTTTWENLEYSKARMDACSGGAKYRAALVTNDYHVFRASEYARSIGLKADGIGCHTKGYYWPSAFIREFVAVTMHHLWPYIAIAIIWVCWSVLLLLG